MVSDHRIVRTREPVEAGFNHLEALQIIAMVHEIACNHHQFWPQIGVDPLHGRTENIEGVDQIVDHRVAKKTRLRIVVHPGGVNVGQLH